MESKTQDASSSSISEMQRKAAFAKERAATLMKGVKDKAMRTAEGGANMMKGVLAPSSSSTATAGGAVEKRTSNSWLNKGGKAAELEDHSMGPASPDPQYDDQKKLARLCSLGFSTAVVKHALWRCGGRTEEAGLWLLDPANADERLAAEFQAAQVSPLQPGGTAQICGLRGAAFLNGVIVTLLYFDTQSERWTVQLANGEIKAIRPRNLDVVVGQPYPVVAGRPPGEPTSPSEAARGTSSLSALVGSPGSSLASPPPLRPPVTVPAPTAAPPAARRPVADMTAQELRAQICEMLGDHSNDMMETLEALSGEELMETIAGLRSEQSAQRRPAEPQQQRRPPEEQPAAAAAAAPAAIRPEDFHSTPGRRPPDNGTDSTRTPLLSPGVGTAASQVASASKAAELAAIEARLQEAKQREEDQQRRAALLEARERELQEAEQRFRDQVTKAQQEVPPTEDAAEESGKLAQRKQELEVLQAKNDASAKELEVQREELKNRSPEAPGPDADEQQKRLEALEAKLLQDQIRWQEEAEAKAAQIRALELQVAEREVLEKERLAAEQRKEEEAAKEAQRLQEQREQFERLQAETERQAQLLEEQKRLAQEAAQDRELRMLEEESEQMRFTEALIEEQSRLDAQRRQVLLLQKSMTEQSSRPISPQVAAQIVQMDLDDSVKKERKSISTNLLADDASGRTPAQSSEGEGGEDDDDEVWDLDWAAVAKNRPEESPGPMSPFSPPVRSLELTSPVAQPPIEEGSEASPDCKKDVTSPESAKVVATADAIAEAVQAA